MRRHHRVVRIRSRRECPEYRPRVFTASCNDLSDDKVERVRNKRDKTKRDRPVPPSNCSDNDDDDDDDDGDGDEHSSLAVDVSLKQQHFGVHRKTVASVERLSSNHKSKHKAKAEKITSCTGDRKQQKVPPSLPFPSAMLHRFPLPKRGDDNDNNDDDDDGDAGAIRSLSHSAGDRHNLLRMKSGDRPCNSSTPQSSSEVLSDVSNNAENDDSVEDILKEAEDLEENDIKEEQLEQNGIGGKSVDVVDVTSNNGGRLSLDTIIPLLIQTKNGFKYKRAMPSLLNSLERLEGEHHRLLDTVDYFHELSSSHGITEEERQRLLSTKAIVFQPYEKLLDSNAAKIFSCRLQQETELSHSIQQQQQQNREHLKEFINRRWKINYNGRMEEFYLLYRDYEFLHRQLQKCQSFQASPFNKLDSEILQELQDSTLKRNTRDDDDYDSYSWNRSIEISQWFLSDLLLQCQQYRLECHHQTQLRECLSHHLRKAKDQRSKLKIYVHALRDELRYVVHKLQQQQQHERKQPTIITKDGETATVPAPSQPPASTAVATSTSTSQLEDKVFLLERILKEEEAKRKKLHNKLQELNGNIRVYCRLRPHPNAVLFVQSDDKLIIPGDRLAAERLLRQQRGMTSEKANESYRSNAMKCYIFDKVFDIHVSQVDVFHGVEDVITSCVDGYNVCIMAYGQTGSGKTYTMMGSRENPGVNRQAIRQIIAIARQRKQQWRYQLKVSMLEIYQEEIFDLLSPTPAPSSYAKERERQTSAAMRNSNATDVSRPLNVVRLLSTQDDQLVLQNLMEYTVTNENEILSYLEEGESNRKVASTLMNHKSSRSHCILLIKILGENLIHHNSSRATLTLCDLAGSENISKSGATGDRFTEATSINRSLSAMGRVFDMLRKKQKPIYRETKLTHLLKPTLGGDSKCLLFINIRSEADSIDETVRAAQFGRNAMQAAPERRSQCKRID